MATNAAEDERERTPYWVALAALLFGFAAAIFFQVIVQLIGTASGASAAHPTPAMNNADNYLLDLSFVGSALYFTTVARRDGPSRLRVSTDSVADRPVGIARGRLCLLRRYGRLLGGLQRARHRQAPERSRSAPRRLGGRGSGIRVRRGADGRGVLLPRLPVRDAAPDARHRRRPRSRAVDRRGDRGRGLRPRALRFGAAGVPDPARLSRLRALHRALEDGLAVPLHGAALAQQLDRVGGERAPGLGRRRDRRSDRRLAGVDRGGDMAAIARV